MSAMRIKGSCHCRAVQFTFESKNYYPFQLCYCSICRKTQGGGGFSINLSGEKKSLKIRGKKNISIYIAISAERNFCSLCGSHLWVYSPEWPELFHPFASCIDTPLPVAPEKTHLMLNYKAPWVKICKSKKDKTFKEYPKESIAEWHERVIHKKGKRK